MGEYLRQFTFVPVEEIDALMAEHEERPGARAAQRRLASEVTTLVHGPQETAAAEAAASALFGRGELTDLPPATLAAALREAGAVQLRRSDAPTLVDAFVASGLVGSRSEARRAIGDGGAYVNNERVDDVDALVADRGVLHGSWLVLRRGKRAIAGLELI